MGSPNHMKYPDVRRAQSSDQSVIGDLWTELMTEQEAFDDRMGVSDDARERWENDFPLWLDDETCRVYVAERKGEVVGFASARRWGPPPIYEEASEVYLDELFVRPGQRRRGYGTQLFNAVQTWTDRVGARRVRLSTLAANEGARAFWAAQDAAPLTVTFTVEREGAEENGDLEGSKKIGF